MMMIAFITFKYQYLKNVRKTTKQVRCGMSLSKAVPGAKVMDAEENRKKIKVIPGTHPKARAGWPKRLRLVQATP